MEKQSLRGLVCTESKVVELIGTGEIRDAGGGGGVEREGN